MHILFCVNKSKFGTKCFVKREQFVLPFIIGAEFFPKREGYMDILGLFFVHSLLNLIEA